ncbi:BZ3500_MvSof-1268-A1-R1_Chr8-1g09883 [Microbotryum saponariae]|uniref:BZ3500_MvSof-1268-A1-R1_Chr8-1g09883 protein n=1 Tax=Microbotryum saponariae TaxID=289078 RepID=A0A2X0LQD8_9BASI|nr:BZ3500_MvSof-1268-A1-R1_Chr8-1g09883 [Microbotryum saponariae]SDA08169.1 BZ3501_MvSof-1269-A2-R1_Chr8-1g09606 [Microbotryum saponariae]
MPETSERTPLLQSGLPTARHGWESSPKPVRSFGTIRPLPPSGLSSSNDYGHPPIPDELPLGIDLPRWHKLAILTGTFVAVFLSSVDTTITGALIQPIALDLRDGPHHRAGWLGPSYLLSSLIFTPFYGRLCDIVGRRKAAFSAVLLFLLGTLGCSIAPSMPHLLGARILAGCGYGGMMTTSAVLTADLFVLKERLLYGGISGVFWTVSLKLAVRSRTRRSSRGAYVWVLWMASCVHGAGQVIEPERQQLRSLSTYVNFSSPAVPVLVAVLVGSLCLIRYTTDIPPALSSWNMLTRIDFGGCATLLLAFGTSLVSLGLLNNDLLWSDSKVIFTSALVPVFLAAFFYIESNIAREPILPLGLLKPRTPFFALGVTFLVAITNSALLHHLPIYFMTVESRSEVNAAAHLLPVSISAAIGGLTSGIWMFRTGRYWGAGLTVSIVGEQRTECDTFCASYLGVIRSALATYSTLLLQPSQPELLKWVLVIPFGIAPSVAKATSYAAMMAYIPPTQIPIISGALWAFRSAGQIIGLGISATVFQSLLVSTLREELPKSVADETIHRLRDNYMFLNTLDPELKATAKKAFANATKGAFGVAVVGVTLTVISFALIPVHSLALEQKDVPRAAVAVAA